jgi:DNA-binding MarR family transcriptional regulator
MLRGSTRERPLDARLETLATDLHAMSLHLVRRLRRADRALGITPARLSALSVLVFGGPRSVSELAEAEQVSRPTMSRIVAALEQAGLVQRQAQAADARAVRLVPTADGTRVMRRGRRLRVRQLATELAVLPKADLRRLERAVEILGRLETSKA